MTRLALLFFFVGLAGCADDPRVDVGADAGPGGPDADGFATLDAGACTGPLEGFCDSACPSYAESVAEVMFLAANLRCFIAESGTCGPLRYTYHSTGFEGFQAWFDAAGTLVAARRFIDHREYCEVTSFEIEFGAQPACDLVPEARYCAH
jgi:hypothetical protein